RQALVGQAGRGSAAIPTGPASAGPARPAATRPGHPAASPAAGRRPATGTGPSGPAPARPAGGSPRSGGGAAVAAVDAPQIRPAPSPVLGPGPRLAGADNHR